MSQFAWREEKIHENKNCLEKCITFWAQTADLHNIKHQLYSLHQRINLFWFTIGLMDTFCDNINTSACYVTLDFLNSSVLCEKAIPQSHTNNLVNQSICQSDRHTVVQIIRH